VLSLSDAVAVEAAAGQMQAASFLVEEMVTGAVAELLVGVVRDPAHGFVLTLGAGGTLTEILRDTVSMLVPSTRDDIRDALKKLRISPLLAGYRGAAAANLEAVVETVMAVQSFVEAEAARLEEIEINPLICTATAAIAADALITIGEDR